MALTKASLIDLNGQELILDADGDTSITVDTDDQIDIKISGSDSYVITGGGDPIFKMQGSGHPQLRLKTTGTTDNTSIDFGDSDSETRGRLLYNHNDDRLSLTVGGSERARFLGNNLFLNGGSDARVQLGGTASTGNDNVHIRGDGSDMKLMAASGGSYLFEQNGTEIMRIDSARHLLVGTTSKYTGTSGNMTVPLQLDIGANDSNSKYVFINRSASTGIIGGFRAAVTGFSTMGRVELKADNVAGGAQTSSFHVYTTLNATEAQKMQIDGNGHVYFNSLYGSGADQNDVRYNASSGLLFYNNSSKRYKKNIKDMPDGVLDKIKQARVVTFDEKESGISSYGLIAEEVDELIPELVTRKEIDGEEVPESIVYSKIGVWVLKAMQEQQTIIEDLKARIETLEGS